MRYFYPEGQLYVALYFAIVGAALCLLYDVFRIKREFFGSARLIVFFDDFVYMLICALVIVVGILKINSGNVRWYETVFACAGFFLYRATVSRVVIAFFFMLSRMLKRFIKILVQFVSKIFKPLLRPLEKLVCLVKKLVRCVYVTLVFEKYKIEMMRKIKSTYR